MLARNRCLTSREGDDMLRFNHMEITVPPGFVARDGDSLLRFFEEIFGFERGAFPGLDDPHLVVTTDPEGSQFLFLAENEVNLSAASEDHLGFHLDSADEVEEVLQRCERFAAEDSRVEIRDLGILDLDQTITRAFYVRYLLPLWFDVQNITAKPGFEVARGWHFGPVR